MFKNEDGYTLTEMLVVIGIIGLIAAALTPALFGQMNRARAKSAELQVETVAAAVEAFRSDIGRYPTDAEGLGALLKEPGGVEGWSGPYVKGTKGITDPWGHALVYQAPGASPSYKVISLGADGKVGGSGLDRDIKAPAE